MKHVYFTFFIFLNNFSVFNSQLHSKILVEEPNVHHKDCPGKDLKSYSSTVQEML